MKRFSTLAAACLFAAALSATPASAQVGGGNGNGNNNAGPNSANTSCTQSTSGAGGTITPAPQTNRGNGSRAALVGVIDALINANALNNLDVVAQALNSSNVQVLCLNDVLNQNDISLLSDVLSGDNIANNSLNDLATNALRQANVSVLDNARIVTVDIGGAEPQIVLLHS